MSHKPISSATPTQARKIAARFLGPLLPWVLHLRPMEWPTVTAHLFLGWLLASGFAWPDPLSWLGIIIWVVALNGGTLAINSAFDQDESDIAYLHAPPPPPGGLAPASFALMLLGFFLATPLPFEYRVTYLACLIMSLLYSVPPVRLKAVGGADWVINMVGFGTLTCYAGWAVTGRALTVDTGLIFLGFCPLFAALYPLTQLYQIDEDRRRGDLTLVIRLGGVRRSLAVALFTTGLAFTCFAVALLAHGVRGPGAMLRWGALSVALLAWLAVLIPWYTDGSTWSSRQHQRGMYHSLIAWALTDLGILIAW